MTSKYQRFHEDPQLLRQSFYWFCLTFLLMFEILILNGFIFRKITNKFIPDILIFPIEYSILILASINALYCLLSYFHSIYKSFIQQLYSKRHKRQNLDDSRADCVKSLFSFMTEFFRFSNQPRDSKEANISMSSTSSVNVKNNSMSSLIGFHDSPLNKFVTSVHDRSQLEEIFANENCDSVVDPSDCSAFFTRDFGEISQYRTGTVQYAPATMKMSTAMEGIQSFISGHRSEYEPRPERRLYHRTFSGTTAADPSPKLFIETNMKEILRFYELDETKLEAFEIKLRIWMCNTIVRPLLEKIDELNKMLAEKYSNLHIRMGQSSLDAIQTHKTDLGNTWLPFLLPYLRVHSNQTYLVNRVRTLAQNIALEHFKWNGGEDSLVRDENNEFNRISSWTDQLPTDTELIWHFFCTYMDFHLSPSSEAVSSIHESRPFSNVYSVKSLISGDVPLALKAKHAATAQKSQQQDRKYDESFFFIRMGSTNPPCFELVIDGGATVILPLKDTQHNFWMTIILFLAHITKMAQRRIGHVQLESLSLNIFDL